MAGWSHLNPLYWRRSAAWGVIASPALGASTSAAPCCYCWKF